MGNEPSGSCGASSTLGNRNHVHVAQHPELHNACQGTLCRLYTAPRNQPQELPRTHSLRAPTNMRVGRRRLRAQEAASAIFVNSTTRARSVQKTPAETTMHVQQPPFNTDTSLSLIVRGGTCQTDDMLVGCVYLATLADALLVRQ